MIVDSSTGCANHKCQGTIMNTQRLNFEYRSFAIASFAVLVALPMSALSARAQISDDVVRIGVLTDMEGVFSENAGPGSVLAAQMAVGDFGGSVAGKKVEVISADHQNKPDVASTIARDWYDTKGVDLIIDAISSPVGLAVQEISRARKKMFIATGSSSPRLSGEKCSETGIQWPLTSYANAKALVEGASQRDGKTWFFLTLDTVGGQDIVASFKPFIERTDGKVVGESRFPATKTDFSSNLLEARGSKADNVVIASSGASVVRIVKQAAEFKTMATGSRFVLPIAQIAEIAAIGLESGQGLLVTDAFYWALNDQSKAWSQRFYNLRKAIPSTNHVSDYTAVLHYLKAVDAISSDDGLKVAAKMREMPINDIMTKDGKILINGDVDRERHLFEVKKPSDSKEPLDLYNLVKTFTPGETTRPLAESRCPLVK
jgi:branched-chain amino acid transport system substrate-binding protein